MDGKLKRASALLKSAKDKAKRVAEDGSQKSSELFKTMKAKAQNVAAAGARYAAGPGPTPPPELPEDLAALQEATVAVQSLYSDGFSIAAARHALSKTGGDVDAARAWLLDPDNADEIMAAELAQQVPMESQAPNTAASMVASMERDLMRNQKGDPVDEVALRNSVREMLSKSPHVDADAVSCVDACSIEELYELIANLSGDVDPEPVSSASAAAAAAEPAERANTQAADTGDISSIDVQMDSMLETVQNAAAARNETRALEQEDPELQFALAASLSEAQARELQKDVDDAHKAIAEQQEGDGKAEKSGEDAGAPTTLPIFEEKAAEPKDGAEAATSAAAAAEESSQAAAAADESAPAAAAAEESAPASAAVEESSPAAAAAEESAPAAAAAEESAPGADTVDKASVEESAEPKDKAEADASAPVAASAAAEEGTAPEDTVAAGTEAPAETPAEAPAEVEAPAAESPADDKAKPDSAPDAAADAEASPEMKKSEDASAAESKDDV